MDPRDVFDFGDLPPYDLDLLGWVRSAIDRTGPVFPAEKVPAPKVAKGTLVLSGGGGVQSPTWRRFIAAAGGEDSQIVCIPSADRFEPGEEPDSYSAKHLRSHGCTNVNVLHTDDSQSADLDRRLLSLLEEATGVWIDGGRTYRVIDAFQHTRAHQLMRDVLKRGGVVGGSSAGCQVAGDFLLRGDPRTNRTLVFEGYTTGLGFLKGVIIDAHFRERNRQEAFGDLMRSYPQMVGIGIDADTALVIEGTTAEVMGMNAVSIYYPGQPVDAPILLEQGQRHDLVKRRTRK